jgi:hypothetical protein
MGEVVSPGATRCAGTDPPTSRALPADLDRCAERRLQCKVSFPDGSPTTCWVPARVLSRPPHSIRVIGGFFVLRSALSVSRRISPRDANRGSAIARALRRQRRALAYHAWHLPGGTGQECRRPGADGRHHWLRCYSGTDVVARVRLWVMNVARVLSADEAERTSSRENPTLCATTGPMDRNKLSDQLVERAGTSACPAGPPK